MTPGRPQKSVGTDTTDGLKLPRARDMLEVVLSGYLNKRGGASSLQFEDFWVFFFEKTRKSVESGQQKRMSSVDF